MDTTSNNNRLNEGLSFILSLTHYYNATPLSLLLDEDEELGPGLLDEELIMLLELLAAGEEDDDDEELEGGTELDDEELEDGAVLLLLLLDTRGELLLLLLLLDRAELDTGLPNRDPTVDDETKTPVLEEEEDEDNVTAK